MQTIQKTRYWIKKEEWQLSVFVGTTQEPDQYYSVFDEKVVIIIIITFSESCKCFTQRLEIINSIWLNWVNLLNVENKKFKYLSLFISAADNGCLNIVKWIYYWLGEILMMLASLKQTKKFQSQAIETNRY